MKFRPEEPMHERYAVAHGFLSEETGREAITISQTVNAFFRWEFNSCEMLVKDGVVYPIDYANACPDVAVTSLHYYFPWAMKALLRWTAYCVVTGRVAAHPGRHRAVVRGRRRRGARLPGQARGLPGAGGRLLRDRALPGLLRVGAAARRRDGARVDRRARLRHACCTRRSSRPTPRTSGSGSRPTSAGCSACGCPTSAGARSRAPRRGDRRHARSTSTRAGRGSGCSVDDCP